MKKFLAGVSLGALGAVLASAPAALAVETINISAVSGYAPTAAWVKVFEDYFVPETDKLLAEKGDYKLNWNLGFSGTVVKPRGELEAVATGIADIGIIVPPFHVDKMPLHNVSFMTPFATSDLHLIVDAMAEIAESVPAFKQEWEDLGLVYLGSAGSVDNYQAVCKNDKPTAADFNGVKIVGAGANLLYFQGVGAVGINSNIADYYNQMQTGIAECASVWAESAAGFKMYEVAPYFIKVDQGATVSFAVGVNKDYWEGLPDEVREVLRTVTKGYGKALADYVVAKSEESLQAYRDNGGTIRQYTQEQRVEWANTMNNIAREWADSADAQGKPGSEILTRYMDFLRANNQPIARNWDKE